VRNRAAPVVCRSAARG